MENLSPKSISKKVDFSHNMSAWANEIHEPNDEIDLFVEEIMRNGYTILENHLPEDEVSYCRKKIDEIYECQVEEFGGEDRLMEIGEQGLARMLLAYDDYFVKLATDAIVIEIVKRMMGDYFILYQQNGNLNPPNFPTTTNPWHRDLTFRHFTSSRPTALTALWVIDDFTEENDALSILPSSHKHEPLPSFQFVDKHSKKLITEAGSVVVFDGLWFHRSGFNRSDDKRRVCQLMYTVPHIGQQICLPKLLNGRYKEDKFLGWLFGYNTIQAESVSAWRGEKIKNKRKNLTDAMKKKG